MADIDNFLAEKTTLHWKSKLTDFEYAKDLLWSGQRTT